MARRHRRPLSLYFSASTQVMRRELCLSLCVCVSAWPTPLRAPPPPTADRLPPPPSPPPVGLANFDGSAAHSIAILRGPDKPEWKTDHEESIGAGLLVLQQSGDQLLVYGMLANLPAGETAVAKIHKNSDLCTVGVADGIVTGHAGVGSDGVARLDDVVPLGAGALSTAHWVGIYTRAGQQLVLCSSVETHEYVQLVDVGRLPAYEGSIEVRGLLALIRRAHKGIGYMDVYGIAAGLEHGVRGQWQFHEGFNFNGGMQRIEDTNTLFPLLYQGFGWGYYTHRSRIRAVDPWTTTMYQSNRQGVALIHEVFSLDSGEYWSQIAQSVASHRDKCGGWLPPTFRGRAAIFHHSRIMYPQPTGYYSRSFQFMACGIVGKYIPTVVRHRLKASRRSAWAGHVCWVGPLSPPSTPLVPPCHTARSTHLNHALISRRLWQSTAPILNPADERAGAHRTLSSRKVRSVQRLA